jgi:hypothetical protein
VARRNRRLVTLTTALALAAGCSSSPSSSAPANRGLVTLESHAYRSGGQVYGSGAVTAGFFRNESDPYAGCSAKRFGECVAHFACKPIFNDPGDGGTRYASAGDVTVGGLAMPVTLTLMTMGMFVGQYTTFMQYLPLFSGGETFTVRAAGAEVPAFSVTVTAPSQPQLASLPQAAVRTRDLSLSWSGGGAGELRVALTAQTAALECSFAAGGGAGKVPAGALALLPVGPVTLTFSAVSETPAAVAGWDVRAAATATLIDASTGSEVSSATIMLQ